MGTATPEGGSSTGRQWFYDLPSVAGKLTILFMWTPAPFVGDVRKISVVTVYIWGGKNAKNRVQKASLKSNLIDVKI